MLTVSEDLHIDLVRAAEPGELLLLDRYAERISEQTWMLTAESVLGAMEQGQDPGVFLEFLEQRSERPLGPTAADFFAEIQNRKVALRDGGSGAPAALLRRRNRPAAHQRSGDP